MDFLRFGNGRFPYFFNVGEIEDRVHLVGLTNIEVTTAEHALELLVAGSALRATHPTARNPGRTRSSFGALFRCFAFASAARQTDLFLSHADSSRSHAICSLTLRERSGRLASVFRVVDLAGSERREDVIEHSMERIQEMRDINWSLGSLKGELFFNLFPVACIHI